MDQGIGQYFSAEGKTARTFIALGLGYMYFLTRNVDCQGDETGN